MYSSYPTGYNDSGSLYGTILAHSPIMGTETLTEAGSLFSQSELTALDGFFDSQLGSEGPEEPLLTLQPLLPQQSPHTSPSQGNYGAQALPYSAWPQPSTFVTPSYPSSLVYDRDAWRSAQPAIDAQSMSAVSFKDGASISVPTSLHAGQTIPHQPFQISQDEKLRSQADELAQWLQMRSGAVASSNASTQTATPSFHAHVHQHANQAQLIATSTSQTIVDGPASNSSASDLSLPTPTSAYLTLSVSRPKGDPLATASWSHSRRSSAIDHSDLATAPSTSKSQSEQISSLSSMNSLHYTEVDEERSSKRPRNEIDPPASLTPLALPPRGAKARRSSSSARPRLPVVIPKPVLPPVLQGDSDSSKPSSGALANGLIAAASGKATPLTEEQKRANHIMSEQRRRTAIRAAYDELCNVVPALRAAVEEYEERLQRVAGDKSASTGAGGVAGVLTGGIEVGGEKIDGRAGPKSEAVVLAKTVDYLQALVERRQLLLKSVSAEVVSGATHASRATPVWLQHWA